MSNPTEKIIYEPHPVSAARKAELREQGYHIIDEIYKPKDHPEAQPAVVPDSSTAEDAAEPEATAGDAGNEVQP